MRFSTGKVTAMKHATGKELDYKIELMEFEELLEEEKRLKEEKEQEENRGE